MNKPISVMPDVQGSIDKRHLAIDKVGIKDIKYPVRIKDRSGREQHTICPIISRALTCPDSWKFSMSMSMTLP